MPQPRTLFYAGVGFCRSGVPTLDEMEKFIMLFCLLREKCGILQVCEFAIFILVGLTMFLCIQGYRNNHFCSGMLCYQCEHYD